MRCTRLRCAVAALLVLATRRGNCLERRLSYNAAAKALCPVNMDSHHAQVSIARSGAFCNPLPAAVLALVHNFTTAQSMQETLPAPLRVLGAHAEDTQEHFKLARSLFRKVRRGPAGALPDRVCRKTLGNPV